MNSDTEKKIKQNSELTSQSIIEALPIGTLVFKIKNDQVEIITINDRLLQFAKLVHKSVTVNKDIEWTKDKLKDVFGNNIYAFAIDEDVPTVKNLVKEATTNGYSQKIFRLKGTLETNKTWISAMCSSRKLEDGSIIYYTLFLDCTNQVLYEQQLLAKQKELEHISFHDTLTTVRNRYSYNLFIDSKTSAVLKHTGIIFADLNGLKSLNDEFGHFFGDKLLISFAQTLSKYFDNEKIFRISGDEFVVISENINVEEFERISQLLVDETKKENVASIGYKWESSIFDLKQSIFQTEQLMLIEKKKFYLECDSNKSRFRSTLVQKLLADMENNKFLIFLQPKADFKTNKLIGIEALIRKLDDNNNIVQPYEFVPTLEKEFLISKIDFFVLEEVCKLLKRWQDEGKKLIQISVNMSRVSIAENDFLNHIMDICEKYQIDHKYIEIEVTESIETKDNRKLPEIIKQLSSLGFSVALDDMGSDYSSWKMLLINDVHVIKLDMSLIDQIHKKEGLSLVSYIVALCHALGKRCIAEGVEDISQAKILKKLGCDYYQGYLLNRPMKIEDFEYFEGTFSSLDF